MKPTNRRSMKSILFLQNIEITHVVAKIQGSVKKLGDAYQNANVALYNKANLQPIAICKPDQNGNYRFLSLDTNLKTFIVAFPLDATQNAKVFDNIVPE